MQIKNIFINKFNLTPNRKKILKNVYWALLGKIINIISSIFVGILVARYLGPKDFGLMNYVISYITLFSILAGFGFDNIEIRELSKERNNINVIIGTAFYLRVITSMITLLLVFFTLLYFESDRFTFTMVMVYSFSIILSSFNVIRNYFTAIVLNEYVVKTEISRTILGAIIKIVLLLFKAPLQWFIIAITFDSLLIASGFLYTYRNKVGLISNWKFNFGVAVNLIKESFPILLSGAAIIIYQRIDQVMIKNMIDVSAVGQFSVAARITEIGIFLPTVIAQTLTPMLVRSREEDIQLYYLKRQQFMDIMVWCAIFLSVALFIVAKPAVLILFGNEYHEAIPVLQIISWKIIFVSLFIAAGQIIVIEGIQKFHVFLNIGGSIISIYLNFLLIPKYGIIGSAWSIFAAFAFTSYFSLLTIKPYFFLFKIQTKSIFQGWRSIYVNILNIRKNIVN